MSYSFLLELVSSVHWRLLQPFVTTVPSNPAIQYDVYATCWELQPYLLITECLDHSSTPAPTSWIKC